MSLRKEPCEYTVSELKEMLRSFDLSTTGTKNELITRLTVANPNVWTNILTTPDASVPAESPVHITEGQGASNPVSVDDVVVPESVRREMELLRREKNLLERELKLATRENEVRSSSSMSVGSGHTSRSNISINNISGLLSEFHGGDDSFRNWEKQVMLLRRTYGLDDDSTKVLMILKLKAKALSWFHSKPEHLEMSVLELFEEMKSMFDQRPNMLALRKEFEQRTWRSSEPFADYFHDKVIPANRVPINDGEIIDYLIDGISDIRLRNQARMQCFTTKTELLEAFKKINFRPEIRERFERKDKDKKDYKELNSRLPNTGGSSSWRTPVRCFNCNQKGHLSTECRQPRRPRGSCFGCGGTDHRIEDCPQKKKQSSTNVTNLVQAPSANAPYQLPVKYIVVDENGSDREYEINAIVDSGSPVSLIKSSHVPMISRSPVPLENCDFRGINGSKLIVLALFQKDVFVNSIRISMSFFVVPDNTMACAALLGRDFISCPFLKIIMGKTIEITRVDRALPRDESIDFTRQIMSIDVTDSNCSESKELDIDPSISYESAVALRQMYTEISEMNADHAPIDFEMRISLKHDRPITFRPRRLAFADREKLRMMLQELQKDGVIRPSDSEFASPIVMVRKKNGESRLCVDFREINKVTERDNFPTPLIDDHLDRLKDKCYFSKLDLKNGFHHVKMAESSIKYTSFVTPLEQFEYLKMPFGLTNAPRVFQRFTNKIFRSLVEENKILLYLDDILIATESISEHLQILREVFHLARRYELKFRLDKCSFLYKEINYLGYLINSEGIRPSGDHVASVRDYPLPRTVKQMHQFIGLASYFRRFVPDFSRIAKPLYDVIKSNKFNLGPEEYHAFNLLKDRLATQPVLAVYSPRLQTELHCDASASGFGAILLQKQVNGKLQPVFYFSRRTTSVESKYHSFELECLAVVYAIRRFHIYLSGAPFKILTDCDSFRLTLSKQDVNQRISRWAMFLQGYDYTIEHRPGNRMKHVDALSRCHSVLILEANTFEQTLSIKQDQDCEIRTIREKLEVSEDKFFELRNGLVYRKINNDKLLFYVPQTMESNVIRAYHDDVGHIGVDKVIEMLTRTYWFPKMREKVKFHISNCLKCIEFSPISGKTEGHLHSIPKGDVPFDTVHVDHYGPLQKSRKGNRYILTVVDAFTKHIRLFSCKTTKSEETIKHLRDYFRMYSRPRRLITDRGTSFTSKIFADFVKDESVYHVLVAVGTPRANGQVERFHRVLTPMLAKVSETPDKWDDAIQSVEFANNNTVCRSTGESPCKLLFGINQIGKVNDRVKQFFDSRSVNDRDLQEIRRCAAESIKRNQDVNERYYNTRHKTATRYNLDDYVMIRNVDTTPGVSKKLIPKFKGPYVVKQILDHDRYVISDIEGFQLTQRPFHGVVGPDQMKHWIRGTF